MTDAALPPDDDAAEAPGSPAPDEAAPDEAASDEAASDEAASDEAATDDVPDGVLSPAVVTALRAASATR